MKDLEKVICNQELYDIQEEYVDIQVNGNL
jgi:hypothetical protein